MHHPNGIEMVLAGDPPRGLIGKPSARGVREDEERLALGIVRPFTRLVRHRIPPLLRNIRERRKDANLDGSVCLCACRHREKGTGARCFALHFSAGPIRSFFRENPHFAGVF